MQCLSELSHGRKPYSRDFSGNFDKKIYYAELAEILTFSLNCISMSFDIACNHILTCRSSQIEPSIIEFLGLRFSHLQSRMVEPVTFTLLQHFHQFAFLLTFWANSYSEI